jgi:hypothetical protein
MEKIKQFCEEYTTYFPDYPILEYNTIVNDKKIGKNSNLIGKNKQCVYILIKNEQVIYVGQSGRLYGRLPVHARNYKFDFAVVLHASDMLILEYSAIIYFKPHGNIYIPPFGMWEHRKSKYSK